MEAVLWHVFAGTRGGPNRIRILKAVDNRPRNANQLAEKLDVDYTTIEHHVNVLIENDILKKSGDEYGAIYIPTERARNNWDTIEKIIEEVE